jgi:hypothetical protein
MAWLMRISLDSKGDFRWLDKNGKILEGYYNKMGFWMWVPGPKVTDVSGIPTIAVRTTRAAPSDALWIPEGNTAGVVSARFKVVIEEFEPGVHQFFPVTLTQKDGTIVADDYFIFHPTRYAPCVLLSKSRINSTIIVKYGPKTGMPSYQVDERECVISRPAYGDHKVFGSLFQPNKTLLITDDVKARLEAERISGLHFIYVRELDEPWIFEKEAPLLAAFLKDHPEIAPEYKLHAY